MLGARRVATTTLTVGALILICFGCIIIAASIYIMVSVFKTVVALMLVITIFGGVMIIVGIFQLYVVIKKNTKIMLGIVGGIVVGLGIICFVIGIVCFTSGNSVVRYVVDAVGPSTCGIDWNDSATGKPSNHIIRTDDYDEKDFTSCISACCSLLGLDPTEDNTSCALVGFNVATNFVERVNSLMFPCSVIVFFVSFFIVFMGVCYFIFLINQREWKDQDEQELALKKGGVLSEEDLARLGKKPDVPLGYMPTRGGKSVYVLGLLRKGERERKRRKGGE